MAYRFRHFPYFMLPLSLVNALSVSLPIMALILELLFIICRTIALMVGVGFHDFYLSVALYSAMYVVTVVIQFFWYARVLSVISYG